MSMHMAEKMLVVVTGGASSECHRDIGVGDI
jgi:hypothetical protein